VELPAPSLPRLAGEPASGWRRAALVAGSVAAVELVALLVIALAFIAKPFADDGRKKAAPAATAERPQQVAATSSSRGGGAPTKPVVLPRNKTAVLVLNGNGISGAAGGKADALRARHYRIVGVGDAQRRTFPRTIVMYRAGFAGEGQRLARDLGLGRTAAVPLDGMSARDMHGAKLVVIVGSR
jgi:hypothetical protein